MTPDVVVDIGNTRIKWGRCGVAGIDSHVTLPPDDPQAWAEQAAAWGLGLGACWAIGGVNPRAAEVFVRWAETTGGMCLWLRKPSELPIRLVVDEPDAVGIDRVFGALAARSLVPPGTPAITIDVGTAVTVNLVDSDGVFRGGGIFPGPRLMALALHEHTAKLPLIEVPAARGEYRPATNTADAIRLGVNAAVLAGAYRLVSIFAYRAPVRPRAFLTGGAHGLFDGAAVVDAEVVREPALNLIGIRLAAGALP